MAALDPTRPVQTFWGSGRLVPVPFFIFYEISFKKSGASFWNAVQSGVTFNLTTWNVFVSSCESMKRHILNSFVKRLHHLNKGTLHRGRGLQTTSPALLPAAFSVWCVHSFFILMVNRRKWSQIKLSCFCWLFLLSINVLIIYLFVHKMDHSFSQNTKWRLHTEPFIYRHRWRKKSYTLLEILIFIDYQTIWRLHFSVC